MIFKNDLIVLSMLRKNARATLTEISRQTHIPISTIYDNLKRQEHRIITKHTSLIDFRALGYSIVVTALVKVNKKNKEAAREFFKHNPAVNSALRISNGYDFQLECVFKTVQNLQEFVENVEEFTTSTRIFYILEDLKRESFLSALPNPTL